MGETDKKINRGGVERIYNDEPLNGIHVVSLALNIPGPVAIQKIRLLGASVTKVEPPGGDPFAVLCPPWYKTLSDGIRVIRLDLKQNEGHREMEQLLENADLLLTSTRPSALQHLKLQHSDLHMRFPRLCQIALIGYPAPDRNRAGHDLIYRASQGLLSPPKMPRTLLVDITGAEQIVSAALTLLFARERGGEAGYREIALSACADKYAESSRYGLTIPGGILGGGSPQYNLYETRLGWLAVATLETHFWQRLTTELGISDEAGYDELREIFFTRTAREWEDWATLLDLPIAAVR